MKACKAATLLWFLLTASVATATPCDPPEAIRFARGQSAAEMHRGIARGDLDCLTFAARADQHLSASISSVEHNVVLQIYRPRWRTTRTENGIGVKGRALPGAGEGSDVSSWSGRLPVTGTYLMVVGTTRGGGDYRLRLRVR